jgi:hypothetical protein
MVPFIIEEDPGALPWKETRDGFALILLPIPIMFYEGCCKMPGKGLDY